MALRIRNPANFPTASTRTNHRRLALLVVVAFVLRIGYCLVRGTLGHAGPQYLEYASSAEGLLTHGTLTSPLITGAVSDQSSALMPPVYAIFVAGVYAIFGVGTFAATLVLQAVNAAATSLAVALVFGVARALASSRVAWLAAFIAAINPIVLGFADYVWDTSLFSLGVITAVWLCVRLSTESERIGRWIGFGFFLGALALLNPALTVAYPILVLWPVVCARGWKLRPIVQATVWAVFGWAIAIAPWTVRNYVQLGELVYVRSGLMLELWVGVCPEADSDGAAVYREQFPLLNDEVQSHIRAVGEAAYLKECGVQAAAAISAQPWRFVRLSGMRAADYWLGTVFTHARQGYGHGNAMFGGSIPSASNRTKPDYPWSRTNMAKSDPLNPGEKQTQRER